MNAVNASHQVAHAVDLAHQVWMEIHRTLKDISADRILKGDGRLVREFHEHVVDAVEAFEPVQGRFNDAMPGTAMEGCITCRSWHELALCYAREVLSNVLVEMDKESYERGEVDPSVVAQNWLVGCTSLLANADFPKLDRNRRFNLLAGLEEERSLVMRTLERTKPKKGVPENPDVAKLAKKIKRDFKSGDYTTEIGVARDFTNGNEKLAQSLLRQLRRFPHLM